MRGGFIQGEDIRGESLTVTVPIGRVEGVGSRTVGRLERENVLRYRLVTGLG